MHGPNPPGACTKIKPQAQACSTVFTAMPLTMRMSTALGCLLLRHSMFLKGQRREECKTSHVRVPRTHAGKGAIRLATAEVHMRYLTFLSVFHLRASVAQLRAQDLLRVQQLRQARCRSFWARDHLISDVVST